MMRWVSVYPLTASSPLDFVIKLYLHKCLVRQHSPSLRTPPSFRLMSGLTAVHELDPPSNLNSAAPSPTAVRWSLTLQKRAKEAPSHLLESTFAVEEDELAEVEGLVDISFSEVNACEKMYVRASGFEGARRKGGRAAFWWYLHTHVASEWLLAIIYYVLYQCFQLLLIYCVMYSHFRIVISVQWTTNASLKRNNHNNRTRHDPNLCPYAKQ